MTNTPKTFPTRKSPRSRAEGALKQSHQDQELKIKRSTHLGIPNAARGILMLIPRAQLCRAGCCRAVLMQVGRDAV